MTVSSLSQGTYLAHSTNYEKGRRGYKVCKITPHIMAGKLTGKQCAVNVFGRANRKASSNYCIGYDGSLVCCVSEENRAYTSSNWLNDCQAITIEVSNDKNGSTNITEASWNTLVNLCVDICHRYNFRLNYDGTKNGSLTRHNMFANTNCPGKYLQSRLPELARIVNERLDSKSSKYTGTLPTPPKRGYFVKWDRGEQVKNLQRFLNWNLGCKLSIDGCIGNLTLAQIKNFQKKYGLVQDGYFGPACFKKMKELV